MFKGRDWFYWGGSVVWLRAVWEHSEKPNYNVNVIIISSYSILQGKGTSNFLDCSCAYWNSVNTFTCNQRQL